MFWLFSFCLGPLSRHGNSAPWAYIVVSLQQCSFFLTLRGNFGADSNNFGPCPSHAFRLSELQSIKDLLLLLRICYCILLLFGQIGAASILINGSNLQRFDPIPWRAPPLQKRLAALQLVVHFSFRRLSRVSGVNPSLGPGLPVPESESLNQAESEPPCQCAPAKFELELEPSTQNTQWQGLVSL